jgi:hypothetical protein
VGALTDSLRVGYTPCGPPGDLTSVMGEAPLTLWGSLGHQMVFQDLVPQGNRGAFCKGLPWSGYLTCIHSAILGDLLEKRKVGHMGLQSISPPSYKTYLVEKW